MSLPFSLFMALKYLKPRRTFFSIITLLSILGVLLGVAILVVVLAVMTGFDDMWQEKILSFNAHILVSSQEPIADPDELIRRVEAVPGVTAAAPFVQGLVFIQRNREVLTPFLRGVDTNYEGRVSKVPETIQRGRYSLEDDEILVGSDLARRLDVRIGDKLVLYSPQQFASRDSLRLPEELRVSGVFDLGMWDFDMGYVLTSIPTARSLYGMEEGVHGLQVMTADPYRAESVAVALREKLGPNYQAQTWMTLNRQLFSALQVEKNMMFFLLLFITIVAAFGITNTLITLSIQKTREIGLLKALGYSSGAVMRIFLWLGWVDGILGTATGIGAGLLILRYRNGLLEWMSTRLNLDLLPKELYRLSEIPARVTPSDLCVVAGLVMAICTFAAVIPALRAARMNPVEALRYE